MSEKAKNFKRLAIKRTKNALKQIRLIGNLSRSQYEYTDAQINKIFGVLSKALEDAKSQFQTNIGDFDLDDEEETEAGKEFKETLEDNSTPVKESSKPKKKKSKKKKKQKAVEEVEEEDEEEVEEESLDEDLDEEELDDDDLEDIEVD